MHASIRMTAIALSLIGSAGLAGAAQLSTAESQSHMWRLRIT
jgi:hypothetical protein